MNLCTQHQKQLAADPLERTEELRAHLRQCAACEAFAADAAQLSGLAASLPRPALPPRLIHSSRRQARRWQPVLAGGMVLAAALALWLGYQPEPAVPSATPLTVAARDAAVAPTTRGPVDLLGDLGRARAVWAGGGGETRRWWVQPWQAPAVEGIDPVSDLDLLGADNAGGLLAEVLEGTNELY